MGQVQHNLWTVFEAVAAAVPDRPNMIWRGRAWSYAETAERSRRLANVITAAGLGWHAGRSALSPWEAGQDLIGLYLYNGPEYIEGTLAGYAARTAPFNVNYRYVADELAYLFDDAGMTGLIFHARFAPVLADVLTRVRERPPLLLQVSDDSGEALLDGAVDYEAALTASSPTLEITGHDPDDLYVLYTGGTTGMPKGTLWRQADIWGAAIGVLQGEADLDAIVAAAIDGGGRFLPNAPLMHGAAQWLGMNAVIAGGTLVINDIVDRLDAREVWSTIEREGVQATLMVGEAFARPLLAELERGSYDASSLILIAVGGAVTSPETKERLTEKLPHVLILDAAGASETGSGLQSVSAKGATAERAVFQAGPTTAVLSEGMDRILAPGDDGLGWFAKYGRIPLGYLGDQAKTEKTFPVVDGTRWSVPGDRARQRADGMVELLGRDSATINTGGEKVFAEEVEQALLLHPAVVDAVVVGRPSEQWGSEVVAIVSLEGDADDADIIAVAAGRLARYKLPKAIVRVPEMLRSPAGKADYRWARTMAEGTA
ncbi:MAG: acyl-CoA synthetase [Actinomycetota bacterium]|nr:acyl-CoA synthetase [Actinomycetota bacterium]